MKTIQKIGGFASLAFGLSFTVLLILLITIASQGYVPGSGNNPGKALEFAGSSIIPYIIYLLYMLLALLIVLIIMALADRLKDRAPVQMQLAMIAASATGIFFLVYAMLGYVGEPILIGVYQQDASLGATAYLAMRVVSNALNSSAIFAAGWAILLTGWAAIRTVDFPKALASLLLLAGGLSVCAFLIPIFSLIAPLLYVIWSVWLGVFLLREPAQSVHIPNLAELASEKSA
jgi:hypothetical protein